MDETNGFFTALIRGENLTETEISQLKEVYSAYQRDEIFRIVTKKKILPFAARTFCAYGLDTSFWAPHLENFRIRNRKILNCLNQAYESLHNQGVQKMFVSENFGALLSADADIGLFASGDVDNYADPLEKERIYRTFESLGYTRKERYTGFHQIAAEFFPPEDVDVPENFYISIDFYPLARLKLPCFIQADQFIDWQQSTRYQDTAIVLPPPNALMYICMLHISLHSFSRAPDIRLYIDLLNLSKTHIDYTLIRKWCIRDRTCARVAVAVDLANHLMKTKMPEELIQLSEQRDKIEKIVFDPVVNDLIYEPARLRVLQIEALCNDSGLLHGVLDILFPDENWMKSVYAGNGLLAHIKHWIKVF